MTGLRLRGCCLAAHGAWALAVGAEVRRTGEQKAKKDALGNPMAFLMGVGGAHRSGSHARVVIVTPRSMHVCSGRERWSAAALWRSPVPARWGPIWRVEGHRGAVSRSFGSHLALWLCQG